jgi:hypothetical protein
MTGLEWERLGINYTIKGVQMVKVHVSYQASTPEKYWVISWARVLSKHPTLEEAKHVAEMLYLTGALE